MLKKEKDAVCQAMICLLICKDREQWEINVLTYILWPEGTPVLDIENTIFVNKGSASLENTPPACYKFL